MRETGLDGVQAPEKTLHLDIECNAGFVVIFIVEEDIENAAARMSAGVASAAAALPAIAKLILGNIATRTAALIVRYVILARFVVRAVVEIAHSCSFRFTGFCQTHGKEARIFLENE